MAEPKPNPKGPSGSTPTTHRPYFTSKKGKRFYAKDYGYKSWPFGRKPDSK